MSNLTSSKIIHDKNLVSKSTLVANDLVDETGDDSSGAKGRFITNDGYIFLTSNGRNFITIDIT